jgi:hypothetical protein
MENSKFKQNFSWHDKLRNTLTFDVIFLTDPVFRMDQLKARFAWMTNNRRNILETPQERAK